MILPYQLYSVLMTFVRKGADTFGASSTLRGPLEAMFYAMFRLFSRLQARNYLFSDLSRDLLLELVAELDLWLYDAQLSHLRADPGP